MSVDGTDCRVAEPTPFNSKWYSHKFNGPGLRYEAGVTVETANIASVHGPFPCGAYPDVKISRSGFLRTVEAFIVNGGYRD